MLDLLTLGPKFTRPAYRAADDDDRLFKGPVSVCPSVCPSIDICSCARFQQQTRRLSLMLSIDPTERRTDRGTDGRTLDRFLTPAIYCAADRVINAVR